VRVSVPLAVGLLLASCSVSPDDPEEVFWEMFRRQAQQSVVHTRREHFPDPGIAARRTMVHVQDEVHDYTTGRHVGANIEHWRGKSRLWSKCVDGLQHRYLSGQDQWSGPEPHALCQVSSRPFLGDGVIPGGLDAEQAEAMIAQLREPAHRFLTAHRVASVHVNGRDYLRISVRARPVDGWDMQHLIFAFRATGLDAGSYPYETADDTGAGADLTYYVDPATLLPAYVRRQALRPGGGEGAVVRVEYVRPARFPDDPLADRRAWSLGWPPEV
jgi:hypothetical protein